MFEKAKGADIGTLNKIIDKVFPQVSTSFTLPEILKYASAYSEYKLVGNMGFPEDKYTDMLSEIGSVVVPDNLVSNVTKLHEFLFGITGYVPSSTVQTVGSNISYTASAKKSREQDRSRHMIAVNLIMTVDIPITAVITKAETPAEIMMTEA